MKISTVLIKMTSSGVALFVLFLVAAIISEGTADRNYLTQLFLALVVPSLVAIWYRTETSKRIAAALVGSFAGLVVWGLGVAMFSSGMSRNPLIVGAVISVSVLVSGLLAFVICQRDTAGTA